MSLHSSAVRRLFIFGVAIATMQLIAIPTALAKKPRPFGGRVVATWDNVFAALPVPVGAGTANFAGIGQMLHMGRTIQTGTLQLGFPNEMGLAPGTGSVTITAANGDAISFDFVGILNAATGEGVGTLTITGGTGRFHGATGSGTFRALIDLSVASGQSMTVVLDGGINY